MTTQRGTNEDTRGHKEDKGGGEYHPFQSRLAACYNMQSCFPKMPRKRASISLRHRKEVFMSTMQPPGDGTPTPSSGNPSRPIDPRSSATGSHWTKRPTHPTGNRGTMPGELPDLRQYANVPKYDLTTVADFVGVRPVTLWTWEQNLGVPLLDPMAEAAVGARYSERDLFALFWLREQVVAGADPVVTAQKLREALAALRGVPALASHQTGPYSLPTHTPSRPLNSRSLRPGDRPSQPIARPPTRPLEGAYAVNQPTYVGQSQAPELREMIHPLLRALQLLDVRNATGLLDSAFATRSVETTCQSLVIPTITRLLELRSHDEMSQPEMAFALNFFKGRLFRLFDVLHETPESPLTFVACGPREAHELDALILALFWRRIGLRVIYFGQEVNGEELVDEARRHRPRVVALTLSTTARLKQIARVGRDLARLDKSRSPQLVLAGQGLARHPELRGRAGGTYLGALPGEATQALAQLLRS